MQKCTLINGDLTQQPHSQHVAAGVHLKNRVSTVPNIFTLPQYFSLKISLTTAEASEPFTSGVLAVVNQIWLHFALKCDCSVILGYSTVIHKCMRTEAVTITKENHERVANACGGPDVKKNNPIHYKTTA